MKLKVDLDKIVRFNEAARRWCDDTNSFVDVATFVTFVIDMDDKKLVRELDEKGLILWEALEYRPDFKEEWLKYKQDS